MRTEPSPAWRRQPGVVRGSMLAKRTGLGASWRSWPGHLGVGKHVCERSKVELEKVDTEEMFRRGKKVSMMLAII